MARNWNIAGLPYQDVLGKPLIPNGGGQFDNPIWSAYNNVVTTTQERYVINVHTDANITKWLSVNYTFGYNVFNLTRKEVTQKYSRAASGLGRIVTEDYKNTELESNLLFTLKPNLKIKDLDLKIAIGNSINQRTISDIGNTGSEFIVPGIYNLKNTKTQTFDYDDYSRRRLTGTYINPEFSFREYLFLGGSVRNDRTSTLPYKNASYYYYEAHSAFLFSNAFKLENNWFDYGKLRLSYAKVGKDAPPNSIQDVYGIGPNFLSQPTTYLGSTTYDKGLTPEFTTEIEAGTELGFFKRRVGLDFTYYDRNSTHLITPLTVPSSTGYTQFYTNIGKINNKGVEIGLTLFPIQNKEVTWQVRANFTKNKNMVLALIDGLERTTIFPVLTSVSPYVEPGKPYGYLRGAVSLRDSIGNLLINPATGGMIVADDNVMIGNPNPDFKLGITNEVSYKGFTLSALFDMTKGGDMYSGTISTLLGRGVTQDTKDRETGWVISGVYGSPVTGKPIYDSRGNEIQNQTRLTTNDLYFSPNASTGATFAINTATEWNVYDATVYRLRSLTLAYAIPAKVLNKTFFNTASISLTASNVWFMAPNFPKYSRFDPEVNSYADTRAQGIELSGAPTTKRFGVNLNFTF